VAKFHSGETAVSPISYPGGKSFSNDCFQTNRLLSLSHCGIGELRFKIVKMYGGKDEVIARVENFLICKAAFEKALFVYQ
jgi:hypothetical protein